MDRRVVSAMLASVAFLMLYSTVQMRLNPPQPAPNDGDVRQGTVLQGTVVQGTGARGTAGADPLSGLDGDPPRGGDPSDGGDGLQGLNGRPGPGGDGTPDRRVAGVHGPVTYEVSTRGGVLASVRVEACEYHDAASAPVSPNGIPGDPTETTAFPARSPGLLAVVLPQIDAKPHLEEWDVREEGDSVVATWSGGGVQVEKRFSPPSSGDTGGFELEVELTVRGGAGAESQRGTMGIVGPWAPQAATPRPEDALVVEIDGDVEDFTPESVKESLEDDRGFGQSAPQGVGFLGQRVDFHLGALRPMFEASDPWDVRYLVDEAPRAGTGEAADDDEGPFVTAAGYLVVPMRLPGEGDERRFVFRYYAGPNSRAVFSADDSPYAAYTSAVPERMFSFGAISNVLEWLLRVLAGTGIGYGLAILGLTLFVRGCMFPLSRKSQISMRVHGKKMAALKPKMDALKEKYADPKRQQAEIMKLMRSEKVSILPGGCLLAFVQMPIWISLYGVLQTTYELRHAGFLWAKDLTAPDHLVELPWLRDVWGLGGLTGGWINLFPLLMMLLWGISARMTPLPADPAQQQQAKMMRWMPMLFGVFLYKFASGLTLYMCMSALWSICEIQVIRRLWLNKIDEQYATPQG